MMRRLVMILELSSYGAVLVMALMFLYIGMKISSDSVKGFAMACEQKGGKMALLDATMICVPKEVIK